MQGIYNITKETLNANNASTYVEAGIQENLRLVSVKYDVSKNGKEFLAFYFENEFGDKLSHTEWPVNFPKPLDAMSEDDRKKWLGIVELQKSRVKQIVETFKPGFEIVANTFKEFSEKLIGFLGNSNEGKLVRVKVVYDRRGYTTLPNNPLNTFIESMEVSKDKSKIRILPSDKMTRPDQRDTEIEDRNPLEIADTESQGNGSIQDNMPF